MDLRPQFAVSPRRLRPRRPPPASSYDAPSVRAPPPATSKKPPRPHRSSVSVESPARTDRQLVSSELAALVERAKEEFQSCGDVGAAVSVSSGGGCRSPVFVRGRFYELYSARRNERLKRKKGEMSEKSVAEDPGMAVELARRRRVPKKAEAGVRKSMPADFSVGRATSSSLRSSVKKRPYSAAAAAGVAEWPAGGGRIVNARSVRRL
ncbi:hypothetical protein OPV22_030507 [Ensete ventricosum]|uniref:Uncharacterized protein n=1 Tax=Ensete ventricosum TaxID=4639 RepID=A0AAV8Q0D5_ENSVE|nr:hypothetical protein OPV22_030507 [Ensete ventricosum]